MENFILSLVLLDITKRDIKTILTLHRLYLVYISEKKDKIAYKIKDLASLTGLTTTAIVTSLDSLIDYNIVGKLLLDSDSVVGRKIKKGFNKAFLNTLKQQDKIHDLKNTVAEATERAGYYVADDDKAYVYNPNIESWKYSGGKRIFKMLDIWKDLTQSNIINKLLGAFKNAKDKKEGQIIDKTKVQGMSVKKSLLMFQKRYREVYGADYSLNWKIEFKLMKLVLKQLSEAGLDGQIFPTFLTFVFEKAVEKTSPVQIRYLRNYANDFLTTIVDKTQSSNEFYYDDNGVMKRRKVEAS